MEFNQNIVGGLIFKHSAPLQFDISSFLKRSSHRISDIDLSVLVATSFSLNTQKIKIQDRASEFHYLKNNIWHALKIEDGIIKSTGSDREAYHAIRLAVMSLSPIAVGEIKNLNVGEVYDVDILANNFLELAALKLAPANLPALLNWNNINEGTVKTDLKTKSLHDVSPESYAKLEPHANLAIELCVEATLKSIDDEKRLKAARAIEQFDIWIGRNPSTSPKM